MPRNSAFSIQAGPLRPFAGRSWRAEDLYSPSFVAFVQTWQGRAALSITFGLMATAYSTQYGPIWTLAATAIAFGGAYRYWALLATTGALAVVRLLAGGKTLAEIGATEGVHERTSLLLINGGALLFLLAASFLTIQWVRSHPASVIVRRPTLSLVVAFLIVSLTASAPWLNGPPKVALWAFTLLFSVYCWYIGYALLDQRARNPSPANAQLGALRPVWSLEHTPIGKGMGYLRKVEAKTPHDLAVVQIKSVKLMAWCLALVALQGIVALVFQDMLGIPSFDGVVAVFGTGEPYPIGLTWQSLILNFFVEVIDLSIIGHASVAVARMAGFNMLRNTYRPLEATSIAEFWNRYFYYFKELLVEFFFMPTFLRYFKKHPTLRIVFATFMAAGVGNWLFHLIRDIHFVAQIGWQNTLAGFQIYAVYCLVLAAGIAVSQVRKKVQHSGLLRGKIIPALCVMSFFCLIQVFDYTPANSSMTLSNHVRLLLYLFGA